MFVRVQPAQGQLLATLQLASYLQIGPLRALLETYAVTCLDVATVVCLHTSPPRRLSPPSLLRYHVFSVSPEHLANHNTEHITIPVRI